MSVIVDIDHDAGNLSEYDGTVTDGGDLSAEVAAALAGSAYGLQAVIDDTTGIYGYANIATPATVLRARFYLDPNSVTIPDPASFAVFRFMRDAGGYYSICNVNLGYASSQYTINLQVEDDDLDWYYDSDPITDEPHCVECQLVRATTDSAADGYAQVWIDEVLVAEYTDVDNYDVFGQLAQLRLGACSSIDAGTSGTLYLDELIANDDGSEIGAIVAGTVPPAALHQHRQRRT